jgi:hypothetical protein
MVEKTENAHIDKNRSNHQFRLYEWLTVVTAVDKKQFKIELKSLILAQIERWRHALHMQVER